MRSVFRKDIVSGDWILVATSIQKKPDFFSKGIKKPKTSRANCPFENPQKSNAPAPLFWLARPHGKSVKEEKLSSWFVQVISNKFPVLTPHHTCPIALPHGPYQKMEGVGFQEVVITRDHDRSLGFMTKEEIVLVIRAYAERYFALAGEKCIEYILIFHNNGPSAGATVPHPHSQILALPIIPPDVARSISGSERYYRAHRRCVHCSMIKKELSEKKRVVYKNKDFVVFCPYASHVSFETRLFPIKHNSSFGNLTESEFESLADAMRATFSKLKNTMNNPDYNFFIHTSPVKVRNAPHYHWHIEILPRTAVWGGVELGTGIEIIKFPPENAAAILRRASLN